MNKVFIALGIVLAIGVTYLLFFSSPAAVTNYPSPGNGVVAFGDSLVVGVGATKGNNFVDVLSNLIDTPIVNLGKSGDTTKDALARLDKVLAMKPQIVLLLLGGNDYIKKVPKEETFANLEKMIETIHATGAVVVLLGVRGGILHDEYEDNFEVLAKKHRTAFVPDVLDGLFGHVDLMSDTIHPNDAGYLIIANKIYPVLNELLE